MGNIFASEKHVHVFVTNHPRYVSNTFTEAVMLKASSERKPHATFEPTSIMCVMREQPVWNALFFWRSSNCQMFGQTSIEKVLVFICCLSGKSLRMTGVTAPS